jgi:protein-S-isoprenylcysteine O-methyltransferase Ste14
MLGEAAVFHSLALADCGIVYLVVASLFVLVLEEPELRWKFGAEYEKYCQRVPRWLPRLRTK